MQSSIAIACRALVMLSFLIIVPTVALLGSSAPKVAEALLAFGSSDDDAPAEEPAPRAPRIRGPSRVFESPEAPLGQQPQGTGPGLAALTSVDLVRASLPQPTGPRSGSHHDDAGAGPSPSPLPEPRGRIESRPPAAAGQDDAELLVIQERLRQWGATEYSLDSWGGSGQLYRFQCRMAVDGNPCCNRYFEATDTRALGAVSRVLAEVETWRSARRRPMSRQGSITTAMRR